MTIGCHLRIGFISTEIHCSHRFAVLSVAYGLVLLLARVILAIACSSAAWCGFIWLLSLASTTFTPSRLQSWRGI